MKFLKALARISPGNLIRLLGLGIRYPLFLYPTLVATRECLQISTVHFGRLHHQNTPANAFRHALWNYLIAFHCKRWSKKDGVPVYWAKTITDWHENTFRNKEMARKMDFHNNAVGRAVFKKYGNQSKKMVIALFLQMTRKSIKMTPKTPLENHGDTLVHLID